MELGGPCVLAAVGVLAIAAVTRLPCLSAGASLKIHGMTNARALIPFACLLAIPLHSAAAQGTRDGDWTMPAKDYASTRYSRLAGITRTNATRLRPVTWNQQPRDARGSRNG